MTNIEALETLVGAQVLTVELYPDNASPVEARIATKDGNTIYLVADDESMLFVEVKQ